MVESEPEQTRQEAILEFAKFMRDEHREIYDDLADE